jgi:hypothetical protein
MLNFSQLSDEQLIQHHITEVALDEANEGGTEVMRRLAQACTHART